MSELKIKKTVIINAEIGKVWEALTKPAWTKKYMFGNEVISDWKVGSPIIWRKIAEGERRISNIGEIEKVEVGKILQYTSFDVNSNYEDIPSNYIESTYELTPKLGKTVLSVTQGDFSVVEDGSNRFMKANTGLEQSLDKLKSIFDNR
jgi:uncharacterized protein YndB with AHSA1/START domain